MDEKPIHDDIPTNRAWQTGRRIYVRCGYKSQLNTDMRAAGARWDPEARALWVGSGKKAAVIAAVRAAIERADSAEQIKALEHWVTIPYGAEQIRARAKQLGAVWDSDTKRWAMRSQDDNDTINAMLAERAAEAERAAAELRQAEREAREAGQDAATARQTARHARTLAEAGRAPTGETVTLSEVTTRRMNGRTARQDAERAIGEVVPLDGGRRGVIVDADVWFTDSETASSVCWHPETHDQAHWDYRYTVAVVQPTQEELDADAAAKAEAEDGRRIRALFDAVKATGVRIGDDEWGDVPRDKTRRIDSSSGSVTYVPDASLWPTTDGRIAWRHPGYYDDYITTYRVSSDPEVLALAGQVFAAGPRTRHGGMTFKVVVDDA